MKKRYAQVGVGGRSMMYSRALVEQYPEQCDLVGLCDTNPGRLALRQSWAQARGVNVPGYPAADFDRMVSECRPDTVIVTSVDGTHDRYICRAMELGCDVITEKPMTTDEHKCQRDHRYAARDRARMCASPSTTATRRRARRSKTC